MTVSLITGINGFVGKMLARLLAEHGHTTIGIAFDRHKQSAIADHIAYGDIRDQAFVQRVLFEYEVESIYHLAAQSIVKTCANDPYNTFDTNIMGTVSLLEACRQVDTVSSIVISTSDKVYGSAPVPYSEDTFLDPKHTYEASKACQDIIGRSYFHNFNLPVKIARCSNIYGPGDTNYSRLIPGTIKHLLNKERPVLYAGVEKYVREFLYIEDACRALIMLSSKGTNGEAYCIGSPDVYSVGQVINMIVNLIDPTLSPQILDRSSIFKEIPVQYLFSDKISRLGWLASTPLESGLLTTVDYYRSINNE